MSINKCFISGNLTRSPELRSTQGGSPVLTFGVAVNDRRRNQQTGQWEDVPNFIDCVLFGNRAQSVQQHIGKGSKVAIEGRLRWSQWTDKTGQKRSKIEVIVEDIEFLSNSKPQNGAGQTSPDNYSAQGQSGPYSASQTPSQPIYDEDIPF